MSDITAVLTYTLKTSSNTSHAFSPPPQTHHVVVFTGGTISEIHKHVINLFNEPWCQFPNKVTWMNLCFKDENIRDMHDSFSIVELTQQDQ